MVSKPVQTSFSLSTDRMDVLSHLLSDPYGHAPLPDELMTAPFHSDSSQRILVLSIDEYEWLAINTEVLLELARERVGQHIEWDGWGGDTIQVQVRGDTIARIGVFGSRIFCIMSGVDEEGGAISYLRIYDLNHAGRAKHLRVLDRLDAGRGVRRISPSLDGHRLPWHPGDLEGVTLSAGHDTFIFCVVSILIPGFILRSQLNEGPPFVDSFRNRTHFPFLRLELYMDGVSESATSSKRELRFA